MTEHPQHAHAAHSFPNYAVTQSKNWMNTAALFLSLAGPFTFVTAIAGIVFGHLGVQAAGRGEADNRGQGVAALIVGYAVVAITMIITVSYIAFIAWIVIASGEA